MGSCRALILSTKPERPVRLTCAPCSELLGVTHRPRVTIRPVHALVTAAGTIIIENPVILCATCLNRGVETVL